MGVKERKKERQDTYSIFIPAVSAAQNNFRAAIRTSFDPSVSSSEKFS